MRNIFDSQAWQLQQSGFSDFLKRWKNQRKTGGLCPVFSIHFRPPRSTGQEGGLLPRCIRYTCLGLRNDAAIRSSGSGGLFAQTGFSSQSSNRFFSHPNEKSFLYAPNVRLNISIKSSNLLREMITTLVCLKRKFGIPRMWDSVRRWCPAMPKICTFASSYKSLIVVWLWIMNRQLIRSFRTASRALKGEAVNENWGLGKVDSGMEQEATYILDMLHLLNSIEKLFVDNVAKSVVKKASFPSLISSIKSPKPALFTIRPYCTLQ